jgi:F0F1-type ATP synthase assembly protein I
MDDKTKNKIGGAIITGALISGGMGFLTAIFMSEPWHSYIGMIIGFAIGGAGCSFWLIGLAIKRKRN